MKHVAWLAPLLILSPLATVAEEDPATAGLVPAGSNKEVHANPAFFDGKSVPSIEQIDESRVKIGHVTIDHKARTVSFSALVNLNKGLIEYVCTSGVGKTHETLFITNTDPLHLSLGMKLLRMQSFENMFPKRDADLNFLPFTPPKPADYAHAGLKIEIEYTYQGQVKRSNLSDMIANEVGKIAFPTDKWLYTNSFFYEGAYQASLSGDHISISMDACSPINYIGDFRDGKNDQPWKPTEKMVQELPVGAKVTIIISQEPKKDAPKAEQQPEEKAPVAPAVK